MCNVDHPPAAGVRFAPFRVGRRWAAALAAAIAVLLVGCEGEQARNYPIPRESYSPNSPGASRLEWRLPAGWMETVSGGGGMRYATFLVEGLHGHDVDVSIVPIPDMRGGELANVNRWRGQVGLGDITESELDEQAEEISIGEFEGRLFDMTSESPVIHGSHHQRILAAALPKPDRTWYFKMSGVAETVGEQKAAFLEFLKSLKMEEPEPSAMRAAMAPSMMSSMGGAGGVSAPPLVEKPDWKTPDGWVEAPGSSMRIGTFHVKREGAEKSEIAVTRFPGTVGTPHGNIVRWRGQVGLGPVEATEVDRYVRDLGWEGVDATLVDTSGIREGERDTASQRIMTVIVFKEGYSWFFKHTGDPDSVGQEEKNLIEFAKSAQ